MVFDLVNGAEERLAAVGGARVGGCEDGVGGGSRDGGGGLQVGRSVAESDAGVGAEEGDDEDGGQELDGAAGFVKAAHFMGRGRRYRGGCRVGEGRHGSFRLATASHGWITGEAGC